MKRFVRSVRCAVRGIGLSVWGGRNARLQVAVAVGVVVAGLALRLTSGEWIAVALSIGFVLAAETFNSALETLADVVSPGPNEAIGRAKDMAAGAVLLAAATALVVAAMIAGRHLAG